MTRNNKSKIVNFVYFLLIGLVIKLLLDLWIVDSYTRPADRSLEDIGITFSSSHISISAWDRIIMPFENFTFDIIGEEYGAPLLIVIYATIYWVLIFLNVWKTNNS